MSEHSQKDGKTTFVSFLLDETGSMQSIKDDTIGGFNAYLDTLQRSDGDIVLSLVSFNSNHTRKRYVAEPIGDVVPLTEDDYVPSAMTPLIDAAVKLIKATDEAVERRRDDSSVVIVMQTDGRENVSVEYDRKDLALLVKEKEAAGWEFVFLGAGLDAFDAARAAGVMISGERVMSYSRARSAPVFEDLAQNLSDFAEDGEAAALDFTPAQRVAAGDEYHERRDRRAKAAPGAPADPRSSSVDDIEL